MIETLKSWDEDLFLWLNSFHSESLDAIVFQATQTITWVPLYLFLAYLMVRQFGLQSIWLLLGLALTVLIADQGTSSFMKPFFGRLRPCQDDRWMDLIHNYGRCGGMYGFASSHAANSFGVATFVFLAIGQFYVQLKWLFLWALLFSYTRIYLGVHYPADVFVGALVGILAGFFAFWLQQLAQAAFYKYRSQNKN
ncbi:phosphatase PAP2 family protein [Pararhodonellum marinum]|uniref:phosphatase PAP2 family protein n=1 Tax=Pararhodonellum marinum TaxID=2755358 RepID=UPI00188F3F0E|nr:phosphatase PAP2 family protein [Pararhodonellum marinum]